MSKGVSDEQLNRMYQAELARRQNEALIVLIQFENKGTVPNFREKINPLSGDYSRSYLYSLCLKRLIERFRLTKPEARSVILTFCKMNKRVKRRLLREGNQNPT